MGIRKSLITNSSKTLITLTIAGLVACGGDKTATDYLESARQSYENYEIDKAIIELKNSIQKDDRNPEARALLGSIYAEQGLIESAEKELARAIELGIAIDKVAINLADAMLLQGKSEDVIRQFSIKLQDPESVVAIKSLALGESYLQLRDLQKAEAHFNRAVSNEYTQPRALLGQSLIFLSKGNLEQAQDLIDHARALNPNDPKTWLTQADIFNRAGNLKGAFNAYQQVVKNTPSRASYYYQLSMRRLVQFYMGRGELDAATAQLNQIEKSPYPRKFQGSLQLEYLKSLAAYLRKDFQYSSEMANNSLIINNNHLGAKLLAGLSDARLGRHTQAERNLQNFLAQVPSHDPARQVLALVQAQSRDIEKALETLEPFQKKLDKLDSKTLSLLAQTSFMAGKAHDSTELLRKALQKSPKNPRLSFSLAQSLTTAGDFEEAKAVLNSLKDNPDLELETLLSQSQIHIQAKEYNEALTLLSKLAESLPKNPLPVSLQGTVLKLAQHEASAREKFSSALEIQADYLPAIRSLAVIEIESGNIERARNIYKKAMNNSPNNSALILEYGQILEEQGKFNEAISLFNKAKELDNAEANGSLMLARLYMNRNQPHQALTELADHREKEMPAIWAALGNAQMMVGEYNNALESFKKLSELTLNSAQSNYLISKALLALGNKAEAHKHLALSIEADDKYVPSLIARGNLSLRAGSTEEARVDLNTLLKITSEENSVRLLDADISMADGDYKKASLIYLELYEHNTNDLLRQRAIEALLLSEEHQEAIALLHKDLVRNSGNIHSRLLLAQIYTAQGERDMAIDEYEKVIELNENSPVALNNIAWLLKDSNPKRALTYAEKALAIAPDNSDIKDTLDHINKAP